MDNKYIPSPLKRFWLLLRPDRAEIRNVYVYAIFNGLVNLSLPIGIQAIINLIQLGKINSSWIILVAFVIVGILVTGLLQVSQMRITERLQQKIFVRAAFEFAYRIPRIKLKALAQHYAPELINRFFDIITLQKGLSKILIDISTATIQVVFGLILLSFYHPFFIIFSLILILLIFAIFKFTGAIGLRTSLNESQHKYSVVHWLEEVARTHTTFKLAGKTNLPLTRANEHVEDYIHARESHFNILVFQYYLMIMFKVLVASGLLIMGGILVMERQMNVGQFVAAEIIILLVLASVEKLVLSLEVIYDVLTSLEKIGTVTDLDLDESEGLDISKNCPSGGLSVSLTNVEFCYPETTRKIINDLNLEIKSNDRLLIIGENDSGKSTLLNLLSGLYPIEKGSLAFNNFPIGNLSLIDLHSVIGDFMNDELLFHGTLYENITMGRERATFENVNWAIEKLGLIPFIKSLPQGYETIIHPKGQQFSNGTIIKLLVARCIADRPKLVLIKDAFSQLDPIERKSILKFLIDKENPWTLVIASTESDYASQMDNIAILKNGTITSYGNYKTLKHLLN